MENIIWPAEWRRVDAALATEVSMMFKVMRNVVVIVFVLAIAGMFIAQASSGDRTVHGMKKPNYTPLVDRSWKDLGPDQMAELMCYYYANVDTNTVAAMVTTEGMEATLKPEWDWGLAGVSGWIKSYQSGTVDRSTTLTKVDAKVLRTDNTKATVQLYYEYKLNECRKLDEPNPIWGEFGQRNGQDFPWRSKTWTLEYTKVKGAWIVSRFVDYKQEALLDPSLSGSK